MNTLQQTIDSAVKEAITQISGVTMSSHRDFEIELTKVLTSSIKKAVEEAYKQAEEIVASEMDKTEHTTNQEFIACDDLVINIIKRLRQEVSLIEKKKSEFINK